MNFKSKELLIEEALKAPVKVGDKGYANIPYSYTETIKVKEGRKKVETFVARENVRTFEVLVKEIKEDSYIVEDISGTQLPPHFPPRDEGFSYKYYEIPHNAFTPNVFYVGYNPFKEQPWKNRIKFFNYSMFSLLHKLSEKEGKVKSVNWNPTFSNGIPYQRTFCWTLEQNQLLLESIFNHINIGTFILRNRSYSYIKKLEESGRIEEAAYYDIVDGKQRLKAIWDFVNNVYPTKEGLYFRDFSEHAIRLFEEFNAFTYGELSEDASDEVVKQCFLSVNFTGVPMSEEHINYVKSIQLK